MKYVGVTFCGNRYEIKLDDAFADFVNNDLRQAGVNLHTDNKPDALLKAYLRLAKQANNYEKEIELLIETLDGI